MAKIHTLILLILIASLLDIGCTFHHRKQKEWKPIIQKKTPVVHEVQWKTETLSTIAKWYTGKDKNRESLANANPNIDPDSLSLGNKVFIPSHLVITRDPLPKKFAAKYYQNLKNKKPPEKSPDVQKKAVPAKTESESIPNAEDDFEVIGPK